MDIRKLTSIRVKGDQPLLLERSCHQNRVGIERAGLIMTPIALSFFIGIFSIFGHLSFKAFILVSLGMITLIEYVLWRRYKRHLRAFPADEKNWCKEYGRLGKKAYSFNARLNAFQNYAEFAEPDKEVDPMIVEKYALEQAQLEAEYRSLMRRQAAMLFADASADGAPAAFHETADLSDHVFMNRVRVEDTETASASNEDVMDDSNAEVTSERHLRAVKQ